MEHTDSQHLLAVFPVSESQLVMVFREDVDKGMYEATNYRLGSGLDLRRVSRSAGLNEVVLEVEPMQSHPLFVDDLHVTEIRGVGGKRRSEGGSLSFIHGLPSAMELKVPHIEKTFPFVTSLRHVHVSVACCTGCNGGVHARNLLVLNHHVGGPWSGIWVRTGKTIGTPYPRWQKVLCAGGVIVEDRGSMNVVDRGWMRIHKQDEPAHHAPPPLPITTADLPRKKTESIVCKSLDGVWVQFEGLQIRSAESFPASSPEHGAVNLSRMEIVFTDASGGESVAYLYQPTGLQVRAKQTIKRLRGFVHAEQPGEYALLSDKEEDILI